MVRDGQVVPGGARAGDVGKVSVTHDMPRMRCQDSQEVSANAYDRIGRQSNYGVPFSKDLIHNCMLKTQSILTRPNIQLLICLSQHILSH